MLNRVLEMLASAQWFDVAQPFEKTVNLTQGACLWLMLTRQGACDTYVKFSPCISLEQEAQRCAAASTHYPTLAPRFVGYLRQDGLDVLVCRAIEHRALDARSLQRSNSFGRVFADLDKYFASMSTVTLPRELTPIKNIDLLDALGAYFAGHALHAAARRWLNEDAARQAVALPNMPQHGDLVLNNIGQAQGGAAVVFDWEDFGASCLPGLDLFTLELSLAGTAERLFYGRERRSDATQQFVRDACRAMQLDFSDYCTLTTVYALVFRHLKRNYGPGVRERMDRLLLDLDRQRATTDV